MTSNRRDFLKFVVAGSVAAGCPFDFSLLAAPPESQPAVDGEHYEICHKVRDGDVFTRPPVSKSYDVVIVGGGMSGLAAAYFLQSYNFLLLEKEEHWGGNAYAEEYQGQGFATGSAYDEAGSESDQLARELGLKPLPINSPDSTIISGKFVADTWRSGLDELPYPAKVRESFKKFRRAVLAIDLKAHPEQLDSEPFSKYFAGYEPEVQQWWDTYGPSNYGSRTADASALVGLGEVQGNAAEHFEDPRVTLPGGNGAITKKLSEVMLAKHGERMVGGATVIGVEQQKDEVHVTYMHQGELKTVAAKAAIMASPKFITSKIVAGIPDAQLDAMGQIRYIPYAVINLIFEKAIYNRGYDTWCPGNTFTDIVVADWTIRNQPGYRQKNNILTLYTPLDELQRSKLLKEESCRQLAIRALADFKKLLPEFNVDPLEVHLYRRGHPLFMSVPGNFTKVQPAASQPMERIFFANTDSVSQESELTGAVKASRLAAEWFKKRSDGKSARQAAAAVGFAG
jgi:monoamine oxidase